MDGTATLSRRIDPVLAAIAVSSSRSRHSPPDPCGRCKPGVNDYLGKPVGVEFLKLRLTMRNNGSESVRRRFAAEDQAQALQSQLVDHGKFHDLIGRSPSRGGAV